jgi:hypothetical protein
VAQRHDRVRRRLAADEGRALQVKRVTPRFFDSVRLEIDKDTGATSCADCASMLPAASSVVELPAKGVQSERQT